ncbi:class I adenylate-forming enzyme family protein [Chelatococcus asaccharovorans]|uniref:Acyl-CoA synthetase (AMP-forming)/AMP-acid ligase II n=1 Tax=Chelatococcus asaccharovorans TaxID=28210 RepID=A0A2V3TX17_9HYPH|nr:class I adenylate-forming enzyme family protein [Chelatococcus asaccharovorans]MBS7705025.1 acyl--CoA ligase [Chelatococcus asaccharovorans]PXW53515.1 acyl-CoA synthetase (AMP-forming)/AMP-acid ligase II [Chelatococcus asaccharovorans]
MTAAGHEGSLVATVLAHALQRPHDEALRCDGTGVSWGDLRERVLATAASLAPALKDGSGRIGLLGGASVELVIAYLATIAAGGCAVPLPVSAHRDALAGMIADSTPDLIVAHRDSLPMLHDLDAMPIVAVDPGEGLPDALRGKFPLEEAEVADPAAAFNIIYSSGTTGRAKGIVHAHAMRYRQAARSLFGIDPRSTMLLATPLYSNTTLMPLLATLFHGGRVILMAKFDAEHYLDLAESERATHTMLVPVQYQRIADAASFRTRDLTSFRMKQSTGAPLSPTVKRAVVETWPGGFLEIYGLTEGGCTSILDVVAFPHKAHTVGRPAAGNDIRIIDEDGRFLPAGARGEIVGRSPTMMSGYFRNKAANDAFYWTDAEGTTFHRTGDIGMFDADGFLVLLDRKKDMIISGGFNIYAADLEEKLLEHPGIADAAVIAVPSERWGEMPLGLVVARAGAALDPAEVLAWTNARLGKMQRIAAVELRQDLPRSSVGKVLKQVLRQPYWETQR